MDPVGAGLVAERYARSLPVSILRPRLFARVYPQGSVTKNLLTTDESLRFWDERHRTEGRLRSGGDIGLSEAENEVFYHRRLGTLLEIVDDLLPLVDPVRALDAGCGKGWFAGRLAECGFLVDCFDPSPIAARAARSQPGVIPAQATLSGFQSPYLYDLVVCIDVLFHILDDDEWLGSLLNLASLVRPLGALVLTDHGGDERRVGGDYIVHRPMSLYRRELSSRGFAFRGFRPYNYRENPVGFLAFVRTEL